MTTKVYDSRVGINFNDLGVFVSTLNKEAKLNEQPGVGLNLVISPTVESFIIRDKGETTQIFLGNKEHYLVSLSFKRSEIDFDVPDDQLVDALQYQALCVSLNVDHGMFEVRVRDENPTPALNTLYIGNFPTSIPATTTGDCHIWSDKQGKASDRRFAGMMIAFCLQSPDDSLSEIVFSDGTYITPYGLGMIKDEVRALRWYSAWSVSAVISTDNKILRSGLEVLDSIFRHFRFSVVITEEELRNFFSRIRLSQDEVDRCIASLQAVEEASLLRTYPLGDTRVFDPLPALSSMYT